MHNSRLSENIPVYNSTSSSHVPGYRNKPNIAHNDNEIRSLRHDESLALEHNEGEGETVCCRSKYSRALKHLLPCRPPREDKKLLPSNSAGLLSFLSLAWLTRLMVKAYRYGLEPADLWTLQLEDRAGVNSKRLERQWEAEQEVVKGKRKPELWRAVLRTISTRVVVVMVISVMQIVLQFIGPSIMLKLVMDYVAAPETDHLYAAFLTLATFAISLGSGAASSAIEVISNHTAARVMGAVQVLIYKKALLLKTGGERMSAQIINFCNNDMERVHEACLASGYLASMPVLTVLSVVYCLRILGPWSLLGQGAFILIYPLMGVIARVLASIRVKTMKTTDKRLALTSEILNYIRLLKMYSWEDSFAKRITDVRKEEIKKYRIATLVQAFSLSITFSMCILATVVTLMGYTLSGSPLTASEAFTIFSIFSMMQMFFSYLPVSVRIVAEAKISMSRIQKLMELPEHHKEVGGQTLRNNLAIEIQKADFSWEVPNLTEECPRHDTPKSSSTDVLKSDDEESGSKCSTGLVMTNENSKDPIKVTTEDTKTAKISNNTPSLVEKVDTLFNINLSIERGKLVGVCGSIGAGKSSLISALCGDMVTTSGSVQVNGRLALVTQQAWIYNDTLRENILVGKRYDSDQYKKVLRVCSLESDLELLANGDQTEIGERGINLSGGQKQRVSLARAVYSDRDIYLLDDPLSALDATVARHVFHQCIKGLLADKTVLLVTHAQHFLEQCDEILVLKGGRIAERRTHAELVAQKGEHFDRAGQEAPRVSRAERSKEEAEETELMNNKGDAEMGKLITEEARGEGSVSSEVYQTFVKVSGGWCVVGAVFLMLFVFTTSRIFSPLWLQYWLDQGDGLAEERMVNMSNYTFTESEDKLRGSIVLNPSLWFYQLVFCLSYFLLVITGALNGISVGFWFLAGCSTLHKHMLTSILRSPISFFDATPAGRIMNRFSRDLDEMDVRLPLFVYSLLVGTFYMAGQIILVCGVYLWFVIPIVFVAVLFAVMDMFMKAGVRELKRLDNTLKSPVTQHIGSCISGLSVIRTFDAEKLFTHRMYEYLDKHSAATLVFRLSSSWFNFHMELISVLVILAVTTLCVFTKGTVSTASTGLVLSMINGLCAFAPKLMRMKANVLSRTTSVERIMEYAYGLDSEAPREIPETCPAQSWPSHGTIELQEAYLRYRPDLPLVLHGITVTIDGGEKIGIVGRTGAGKTSFISTLLRLRELDSGRVLIDGVDVSTLGLHSLRSNLSVIPQEPVLFQGSMRFNLDPFEAHTDEALWQALELTHLKPLVQQQQHGLSCEVEAGGENFSVGMRQLICLARALLRNSKILLLDEATASVDMETNNLIHDTLQNVFQDSTVLTIAHRLNTVAHYDRILVLDAGKVREFDKPAILMSREGSLFREMLRDMGVTTIEQMMALT